MDQCFYLWINKWTLATTTVVAALGSSKTEQGRLQSVPGLPFRGRGLVTFFLRDRPEHEHKYTEVVELKLQQRLLRR